MEGLRNHDPWCIKCIYYAKSTRTCDYILIEDHPRPCPGGQGCTARKIRRDCVPGVRTPKWDSELGRLLWLDGKSDAEIAAELGTTKTAVTNVRLRRWMKGSERPEPKEASAPPLPEKVQTTHPVSVSAPAEPKPEPTVSMATPDGVYRILEEATKTKTGIEAICTADAILCLWNWDSADDLRRARDAINHLIKRLEG